MSYSLDRDELIANLTTEGLDIKTIRALLRAATILDRLAVAMCNGDWPADDGRRETIACVKCERHWHPSAIAQNGLCQNCRTEARVRAVLPAGFTPVFGGDPRGCVLKIAVPSGKTDDWGREGLCVPVRNR